MHFNKIQSLPRFFLAVSTVSANSTIETMPVDMIMGFPVEATLAIRLRSVFSKEAIL